MKWYAISGSWRTTNKRVKKDVIRVVKKIVKKNDGILTGGALGVDYTATQTVLKYGNPEKQLKIYLPIKLKKFCKHYFKRAGEGVITQEHAEKIVKQLRKLKKIIPENIHDEWGYKKADKESYYARNTKIVEDCDELYAFQANNSKGTQDAVNKASKAGKTVHLRKYNITIK